MTPSSLQTQCPHCQTRFRVTDEQLSVAGGKVRCGSCMKVFHAVEQQVASAATDSHSDNDATRSEEIAGPASSNHPSDDDFVFADNPEVDAAEGRYAGSSLAFSDEELSDSFRQIGAPETQGHADTNADEHNEAIDESWAEAILDDDVPEPPPEKNEDTTTGDSRKSDRPDDLEPGLTAYAPSDNTEHPTPQPQRPASAQPAHDTPALYHNLRRDPVSVTRHRGWLRPLIWSLLILALTGTLVAQIAWLQFDRLSAMPQLRPFYEKGCDFFGCKLKPLSNTDAIQSRKLVVRTNPDDRGQLIVDAVIINRAGFEQPYPVIALTFSNLNGSMVAQNIFNPDEYLSGETENHTAMPKDTPVRIAITIQDPGRNAVNYNLDFRPQQP